MIYQCKAKNLFVMHHVEQPPVHIMIKDKEAW